LAPVLGVEDDGPDKTDRVHVGFRGEPRLNPQQTVNVELHDLEQPLLVLFAALGWVQRGDFLLDGCFDVEFFLLLIGLLRGCLPVLLGFGRVPLLLFNVDAVYLLGKL